MSSGRIAEHKPLSFSTTMRNPARISEFLLCILPYEGQRLTNAVIDRVTSNLIKKKLYRPNYINKTPYLKSILNGERDFTEDEVKEIIKNSPQNHKEAGFDKGWSSRFDTWYKLPMEFGFIYYEIGKPIVISTTGHMLIDACVEMPINNEKIKDVFLNALAKYQTNNPFRKNANDNSPLILLLQLIKLLKEDPEESDAGVFRSELSLLICWPNRNVNALYQMIKELRKKYKYTYGDEIVYELCLKILGATEKQKSRFKIKQITGEAVDEFIRKMRITGIVSLRGNGRFVDFNSFESERIKYVLDNYADYSTYTDKKLYFEYMGTIDSKIVSISQPLDEAVMLDAKSAMLNRWSAKYSKEEIIKELHTVCRRGESKNPILRIMDKPTRLEFLTSVALKQNFQTLEVHPNYHVDDEGLPTFTAAGGMADIECFDSDCNSLVEVTLMCTRNQAINEMPAVTRHLQEAIEKYPCTTVFSVFIAPSIHADTKYMAGYSKFQYGVNIVTFTIGEFIEQLNSAEHIAELLPM